ncbi:MAG TPA: PAS domain-containing protein [Gammaproteobacteria bacterium]|nr:PAS domain-containing protein [Gammaproteobacteria bacterium]
MRPGFDFFVLLLVTAVLGGLAELIHTAVLADLDRLAPAFAPFLHGGLVALVLAPLSAAISRQLATTRAALACAARGERLARSRIALIGEALRAGQFTVYEVDVERDRLRVLGGGGVIGREDGDAPFAIEDWLARCHPEDEAVVRAGYVALVDGTAASFERSYRRRADDGTWRWLRVYAHVSLADAAGRARRIVGAVCDVTRQRDAEAQVSDGQRLLHAVLDLLPVGVFWKDREGRYLGANRAFLDYCGRREIVGLTDADFLDPAQAALYARHDAGVVSGAIEERNALRETTDAADRRRWYISNKVRLRAEDGQVIGVVGTCNDVTPMKDTERRLRETSERFELALRGSSDGWWDWNLDTDEVSYSARYEELLGFAPEEYGKDFATYVARLHPEDKPYIFAAIDATRGGPVELDIEYRMQHRSGEWRWYRTRGRTVRDADGVARRMAGTLSDITERKACELEIAAARAHLSDAIEALDSAIVMFDAGQRLVFCNSRYSEIYDLPTDLAVPGVPYSELIAHFFARHPDRRRGRDPVHYAEDLFARHRAGGRPWDFELGGRWLLVSERPTQDGGVVCLHTDVSRLKQTQRALEQALQRAESANRAKSQFVANVSHELRTPLNGVLGMLQLMESGELAAPHDEYARIALQAGHALRELIDDILDFSRNEAGEAVIAEEIVKLPLLVEEIVAAHARRARVKGLALQSYVDPALPERVYGDAVRIAQVLSNLLGNAIKFTERGVVRVELRPDPQRPQGVSLVVADTGIGITREVQARLFEPFTQGDGSHTRRHGGTGLGLALVRQQIELMGGSVELESEPGRGSRFECRLSLVPVGAALECARADPGLPAGFDEDLRRSDRRAASAVS